jgi:hypothetical protein
MGRHCMCTASKAYLVHTRILRKHAFFWVDQKLEDLFPKIIFSQKCHMNVSPILDGYGSADCCSSRWFGPYIEHQDNLCVLRHRKFDDDVARFCFARVHTPCFQCSPVHGNLGAARVRNSNDQFCGPPQPIDRVRELCHVSAEMWDAPSGWTLIVNPVLCRSDHLEFLSIAS